MSYTSYEEHYQKYIPAYNELAFANGGKPVWIPTDKHDGWYVNSAVQDENSVAWERGYPKCSRPSVLPDDLSPEVERTAYTTISYAPDEAYEEAYYRREDDDIDWMDNDSDRLPDYGDISAWSLFVDIDIHKDYKQRPLPDNHKTVVKKRLGLWANAFSEMSGGMNNVKILDSGGGMYVFVPPTALSPIADAYNQQELNLIFNEIGTRMRSVTGKLDDLICNQDEAPKELFSADKVQNKNRQFKTIGSIHKTLDTVVYPILPQDINIQYKTPKNVKKSDIEKAIKWSSDFTDDRYRECVDSIIDYLFQGDFTKRDDIDIEYVEGDNWRNILDSWVEGKKKSIKSWKESKEERDQISEKQLKTDITQDKSIATEAVRRVNNEKLKDYIIDYLGSDMVYEKSNKEMDFFPFWRSQSTESGRSAFYDEYEGQARFTDKSSGASRGIIYWIGLEITYDDTDDRDFIESPSEDLEPSEYSQCVRELRNRGEQIPILVPEVEDDDKLSKWRINQLSKQLGIADKSDFIDDGNGSKVLRPECWNETLNRLDFEDIKHNRNKKKPLDTDELNPPKNQMAQEGDDKEQIYQRFFDNLGHYRQGFESRDEYREFINGLPKYVTPFVCDGEILGGSAEGVVAGCFVDQDENTVVLSHFEPYPIKMVDILDEHTDLSIAKTEKIDKDRLTVLVPPDKKP